LEETNAIFLSVVENGRGFCVRIQEETHSKQLKRLKRQIDIFKKIDKLEKQYNN